MSSIKVFFTDGDILHLEDVVEGNSNSQEVLQIRARDGIYSFPVVNVKYFLASY